jgi:hypothetical protein
MHGPHLKTVSKKFSSDLHSKAGAALLWLHTIDKSESRAQSYEAILQT